MTKRNIIIFLLIFCCFSELHTKEQRKYLIENFTNSFSEESASANENLYYFLEQNPDLFIPIFYHTDYPSDKDYFFQKNKQIAKNKLDFYSDYTKISKNNFTVINGRYFCNPNTLINLKRGFDLFKPEISPISITSSISTEDTSIRVTTQFISDEALDTLIFNIIILEYQYSKYEIPIGTYSNSEKWYKWTPLASFYDTCSITDKSNNQYLKTYINEISLKSEKKKNNIYAVAYVQDLKTGEILQSNSSFAPYPLEFNMKDNQQHRIINQYYNDTLTLLLKNPNNRDTDYSINVSSDNPTFYAECDTQLISIPAGKTTELKFFVKSRAKKAEFSKITFNAVPILNGYNSYDFVKSTIHYPVYFLTNSTKFATIYSSDFFIDKFKNIVSTLEEYNLNWTFIPWEVYSNGYRDKLFDMAHFLIQENSSKEFSCDSIFSNIIKNYVEAKKNIILTSPNTVSTIFGRYLSDGFIPSPYLKDFFTNNLGITLYKQYKFDTSNTKTSIFRAQSGQTLSRNLDSIFIQHNFPELYAYDGLDLLNKSSSSVFIYNSENVNEFTTIFSDKPTKTVFSTIGFEQFKDSLQTEILLKNIMNWFGVEKYSRKIETLTAEFNFITPVGDTTTHNLFIRNVGTEDIKITNIRFTQTPYGFLIDTNKYKNYIIKAADVLKIPITFAPKVDINVITQMIIENESVNYPELTIKLYAYSYVGVNSDEDCELLISPNPVNDYLNIKFKFRGFNQNINDNIIKIYNVSGKLVYSEVVNSNLMLINTSIFSKGTYFLIFNNKHYPFVVK